MFGCLRWPTDPKPRCLLGALASTREPSPRLIDTFPGALSDQPACGATDSSSCRPGRAPKPRAFSIAGPCGARPYKVVAVALPIIELIDMRHLAISLMLATLPLSGCSSKSNEISQAFQQSCPKPDWWDEVSIERVQIDNLDQLSEYWKRKTRSARKFFKAAGTLGALSATARASSLRAE